MYHFRLSLTLPVSVHGIYSKVCSSYFRLKELVATQPASGYEIAAWSSPQEIPGTPKVVSVYIKSYGRMVTTEWQQTDAAV